MAFSEQFDQLLLEDTTLEITISSLENNYNQSDISYDLLHQYDPNRQYDNWKVKKIVCSKFVREKDKLGFVGAALADTEKNLFKYYHRSKCDCLSSQIRLKELFKNHFKNLPLVDSITGESHRYFDFIIENQFEEGYELMMNYMKERNTLDLLYPQELRIPLALYVLGYEEDAIQVLSLFQNEYAATQLKAISLGSIRERKNVFALLGLSENQNIRESATEIAFQQYASVRSSQLGNFLKYVDLTRYKKYAKDWFVYYNGLELDDLTRDEKRQMRSFYEGEGLTVASELGLEYWNSFNRNSALWGVSNITSFEDNMLRIAMEVVLGDLSSPQKEGVLDYLRTENRYLVAGNTFTSHGKLIGYFRVVRNAFPDREWEELKEYLPEKYQDTYWGYIARDIERIESNKSDRPGLSKIADSLRNSGLTEPIELDRYDQFLFDTNQLFKVDFLSRSSKIISFDAEAGIFPVSYRQLFEYEFYHVLISIGLDSLTVIDSHDINKEGCTYTISILNGRKQFSFTYTDNSDWYRPAYFVKALNLAIADLGIEERLISIETYDQTVQLGLFNPDTYFPIAKEMGLFSYGLNREDKLMSEYE